MEKKKFSFSMSPSAVNFIIIFVFLSFIVFSNDESSIRYKIKFWRERLKVEGRIEEIREQMQQDSIILSKIRSNDGYLEKYARENIFMSGKDEVIFKIK